MRREYCDRCGQQIGDKYLTSWVRYYDVRTKEDGCYSSFSYQYGTFKQDVCDACLDELKPTLHSKVADRPAGIQYVKPIVSVPLAEGCSGCWLCRLKRRFRRTA